MKNNKTLPLGNSELEAHYDTQEVFLAFYSEYVFSRRIYGYCISALKRGNLTNILLDLHAKDIVGSVQKHSAFEFNELDCASVVLKKRIIADHYDWIDDQVSNIPISHDYERNTTESQVLVKTKWS